MADAKTAPPVDDDFDTTSSAFLNLKDLKGCLIAYLAYEVDEIPTRVKNPNAKKGTFSLFKSVVVLLDGKPAENVGNVTLPETFDEFGLSGAFNERLLKDTMKKQKPKIARVVVEKNTAGTESAKLSDIRDGDLEIARKPANREAISAMHSIAFPDPFDGED